MLALAEQLLPMDYPPARTRSQAQKPLRSFFVEAPGRRVPLGPVPALRPPRLHAVRSLWREAWRELVEVLGWQGGPHARSPSPQIIRLRSLSASAARGMPVLS